MTIPSLVGVTDTDDLYGNVLARNQDTGVLMPAHTEPPDVILIAGQSNASGNGHPVKPETAGPHPLVEWWHNGRDRWAGQLTQVVEPTAKPYDASTGTSPGVQFAREWATWHRKRVILINAAWGGTGLISGGARWQSTGDLYKAAVQAARDAIEATGGRLAAIFWAQGEQDSVSGVSDSATDGYSAVAAQTLGKMRGDIGNPDAWVAVGSMVPDWVALGQGTAATIQGALASLPGKITHCVHAYGPYGTGGETDGIHYTNAGTRNLGRLAFAAYRRARFPAPALPPARPAAPGLTGSTTGVDARWTPPPAGATTITGYQVRSRTALGGAWTTGSTITATTAAITGTDVLLEVQVRAQNSAGWSPWSESSWLPTVAGQATLLLDCEGPGGHNGQRVTTQPIGKGRTVSQSAGATGQQPWMDRDNGIADAAGLVFDGGQYLGGPVLAVTDLANAAGMFTVIAVTRAYGAHDGSFFGWRSAAASIANFGYQADGQIIAQAFGAGDNEVVTATATTSPTVPHILAMDRWGGGVTLHIDGAEAASVSGVGPRSTGSAQVIVGAAYRADTNATPLQFFQGRLAFLMVVPFAMSAAQKAPVYAYLKARYNL